jgi:hypothetical protein
MQGKRVGSFPECRDGGEGLDNFVSPPAQQTVIEGSSTFVRNGADLENAV